MENPPAYLYLFSRRCRGKLLCLEVKARDFELKTGIFLSGGVLVVGYLLLVSFNIAILDQAEQFKNIQAYRIFSISFDYESSLNLALESAWKMESAFSCQYNGPLHLPAYTHHIAVFYCEIGVVVK